MPRYNITLSSAHNDRSPITVTAWAQTDDQAKAEAMERLRLSRTKAHGRPLYDQWEVWRGYAKRLPHKVIGQGTLAGER